MKKLLIALAFTLYPALAFGADVTLQWDASVGATGYKLQMSTDSGATWSAEKDTTATTYVWTGAPDTGLVLFRVAAYNATGKAIRTEAGVWYRGDWIVPNKPQGVGVK